MIRTGLLLLLLPSLLTAQVNTLPPEFQNVDVVEKTGTPVPRDLVFVTETADTVTLGSLLESGRPVILNPVYYECPMLCTLVLNGLTEAMKNLDLVPGKDYTVITFSINPAENAALAAKKKQSHIDMLGKPVADGGWYFLTGPQASIDSLTAAAGFGYRWDEATQQYAHAAAILFLSPNGVITRYLYGIEFKPFDVTSALNEASNGTIGSTIDRIVMYCYTYDAEMRSYVPHAKNIMKLGGLLTMILLGGFLTIMWSKEKIFNNKPQNS